MVINRFNLIEAISYTRKSNNDEVCGELLKIYYHLLEHEEINDNSIVDFLCMIKFLDQQRNRFPKA